MTYCANCGTPLDECNESQPVCPGCGDMIAAECDADLELADDLLPEADDEMPKAKTGLAVSSTTRASHCVPSVRLHCNRHIIPDLHQPAVPVYVASQPLPHMQGVRRLP